MIATLRNGKNDEKSGRQRVRPRRAVHDTKGGKINASQWSGLNATKRGKPG